MNRPISHGFFRTIGLVSWSFVFQALISERATSMVREAREALNAPQGSQAAACAGSVEYEQGH